MFSTLNSVFDRHRIIKIGIMVGHEKHSRLHETFSRSKVKGQV